MATKHDQILEYIETLPVGERISVRSIAKNLNVSEGTAYRAIKEAENIGLVSTIERVGTIRIERKLKGNFEKLTFGEVVKIIEGNVLGGESGLSKTLSKFVIGAMTQGAMERYISPGSLMIVGNREEVQGLALRKGSAVLITGGFETTPEIINLADKMEMPILSTTYDTFTVATLINRAMSDQLIKKDIILVGDIYTDIDKTTYLLASETVADYRRLSDESTHTRFPVVNKNNRVLGIITAKDIIGKQDTQTLDKVMTKDPNNVKKHMSVASVGHMMIWDGLEMMPVVADDLTLLGIISRQDVMKAMQLAQRQPQVANTIADEITGEIETLGAGIGSEDLHFAFTVTPQMVSTVGTISFGVLSEIISNVSQRTMYINQQQNVVIEQVNLHYFRLIQLESRLDIRPRILEIGRRSAKLDIEVFLENAIVAKAIVVCQLMEKS
ncbi:CBS domain-containing protein [Vagococcus coleopterorum]|uniref:CBS domain-containing protein n=1 Tax=Vagococcus coleopterorum TaxID=2714946 RepID=A0A6G8ALA6_9ENTE|nr:DRTGG domain-containing protein [Vagococcus coleopterorum]QIL45742.1 CBS domain-containing protein [Vagococcus coleopterorum]